MKNSFKCFYRIQFASHSPQNIKLKNVFPKLKLFYILQNWKLSTYTTRISIKSYFQWVTTMEFSGRSLGLHSRNWIPVMFYSNTDCHIICSYISTIKVIKIFGNKKCEQLTGTKSQQWLNSPDSTPKLQIQRHINNFDQIFPVFKCIISVTSNLPFVKVILFLFISFKTLFHPNVLQQFIISISGPLDVSPSIPTERPQPLVNSFRNKSPSHYQ